MWVGASSRVRKIKEIARVLCVEDCAYMCVYVRECVICGHKGVCGVCRHASGACLLLDTLRRRLFMYKKPLCDPKKKSEIIKKGTEGSDKRLSAPSSCMNDCLLPAYYARGAHQTGVWWVELGDPGAQRVWLLL